MRFTSTRGPFPLGFLDASLRAYPGDGGLFMPEGGADIRSAVYSPAAGFLDAVSIAASELLSADIDPPRMAVIMASSFGREPLLHRLGDDILVPDLCLGPTGSAFDYSAGFTASFLSGFLDPAADLVVAAATGREASALAAAFAAPKAAPALPLVLLLPQGERLRLPDAVLSAPGSPVIVLEVRGGIKEARALERAAASGSLGGRRCVAAGPATPSRLIGRSLLLTGLFSLARAGFSGDLIVAAPPRDLVALVTGLWAWSWGLPVSAFLLPRRPGEPSAALLLDLLAGCGDSEAASGAEFLECFDRDYALGSLVMRAPIAGGEEAGAPLFEDGFLLDQASTEAVRAAKAALETGIQGHARIIAPRFADPFWDGGAVPPGLSGAERGRPPLASTSPDLASLSAVVAALL
jgi:hypothetical protein